MGDDPFFPPGASTCGGFPLYRPFPRAGALAATALLVSLLAPLAPADSTLPVISDVAVDARATLAVLTWTTDAPATGSVEYGPVGVLGRSTPLTDAGTAHVAHLTHLSPGTAVAYRIVAATDAGASVHEGTFTTGTSLTYWLHNVGAAAVKGADELNSTGDNDGRGYNGFGAALATAESALGVTVLAPVDDYPTQNGGLRLDPAGTVDATLFVKFTASGPTVGGVGTTVARGPPAAATFRVSLLSGQHVLASGAAEVLSVPGADLWHQVDVSFPAKAADVAAGTLVLRVSVDRATAGYVFGFEGDHASRVQVPVLAGAPQAPVRQTDFTSGARVVVAVIDSGINPYHPIFQRPGATLPLDALRNASDGKQARPIALSKAGTYRERVDGPDNATWNGIGPRELVWFEDTNVLAISIRGPEHNAAQQTINLTPAEKTAHRVRDVNGHGTATASTVLQNFPDAIVVMVQITTGAGLADATQWAASQPWIDVISTSWGAQGNVPSFSQTPLYTRQAYGAGKVVVNSAGNDPSPLPTDYQDGPTWVIAVTGSQSEGRGKEVLSGNVFPDYVADYTVMGAVMDNVDDAYGRIGGTSFSCPTVAGAVAGIVHAVRAAKGHEGGIVAGELAPGVTNRDVRAALNKTALLDPWDGYVLGLNYNGDHTHAPGAPWLTAQWGHVDDKVIGAASAAILAGDYAIPPEKALAAEWKAATFRYRAVYWDHLARFL